MVNARKIRTHLIIDPKKKANIKVGWRYEGKYFRVSTGTKNERKADPIGEELFQKWCNRFSSFKPSRKDAFEVEITRYDKLENKYLKEGSRVCIRRHLRRLHCTLGISSVSEATMELVLSKVPQWRDTASPKHWKNMVLDNRKFFRWCIKQGLIDKDPTADITLPRKDRFRKKGIESVWPEEEFKEVCKLAKPKDKVYLEILRHTGMDVSDLCLIEKKHIMVVDERLTIVKKREKAKSDEETIIQPINSTLLPYFEKALERPSKSKRLFSNEIPKSFGRHLYQKVMRLREKIENVPHRDLKALRHTFATWHVERGVPIDVLRQWMGHARDSRILEKLYSHRKSTAQFMD